MFTAWLAAHRRSLLFVLLLPVLAGIAAAVSLPVTLFPNVSFPRVRLIIEAGDRPAEQMVLQVTAPIELVVRTVPTVTDVRSTTSRGTAELSIFFAWGTDMASAMLQVNAEVSKILPQLPPGATIQTIRMDPTVFPIISYSMTSSTIPLAEIRDLALYQVRPLLASIKGVSNVGVSGGSDQEYHVLVDPEKLKAADITVDDVAKAVGASNVLQAIGRVEDRYKLYLLISDDALHGIDDLRHIAIRTGPDGVTTVGDVATVQLSTVPLWARATANGNDAILFDIYERPGGNSVQIASEVRVRLQEFRTKLPPGVRVANWYDQSELVSASASSVRDAIIIGTVLAALVLLLFLRSFKMMFIAMLVVPAALSATIVLLWTMNMSFNIMTLGGMAAAVGLVIDDAIVMVEHIVRRLRESAGRPILAEGRGPGNTVLRAAAEFTRPLAGSSAATIVIFLPLAMLSGVTGAFFKELSLTMAASLLFSFVITWLAVPLAAEWLLTARDAEREDVGRLMRWFHQRYAWFSTRIIRRPGWMVVILALPLVAGGYLAFRAVGTGFMPVMDEGGFIIDYYSAPGTALSETDRLLRQVEAILEATPDVATWSRRTGLQLGGGLTEANRGDFFVKLKSDSRRPIFQVMSDVRDRIENQVPGLSVEMAQLMEDVIGDLIGVPQPIEVKLYGDQPAVLIATANKVADGIGKLNGIVEVRNGINPAGGALDIRIDRVKAAFEGIDPAEATRIANIFLHGQVVTQIPTSLKQIGVRVWSLDRFRKTELDLANLPIRAPDGHVFPLQRIANIAAVNGQPQITRENLQHMIAVTARLEERDLGSAAADVRRILNQPNFLPQSVRYELGGLYQQQQIAFRGLVLVFAAAAGAVFTLLLFLYERFSVAISILIMPLLAACAVFVGLWLTGVELNVTAMMGMTMIIGIVTEVAIFLFSEFDDLSSRGMSILNALIGAGRNRMRPIVMTTIAAIVTLLPLALALGQGAAMQQPLAIAIISGLVVQLPLVLLVMPALYLVIGRASRPFCQQGT
jgi:CzcA family heavy metal efflux pump